MLTARMVFLAIYMLVAGLVGGYANFLNTPTKGKKKNSDPHTARLFTSLLLGVVASFITPLFLSLTKSDLFNNLVDEKGEVRFFDSNVFVFFGFCLVAAFSSRVFLDSLTRKVMELSKDVGDLEDKTEAIGEQQEELAENTALETGNETADTERSGRDQDNAEITTIEYKVLQPFINSAYIWRSISAVAREASLPRAIANRKATKLVEMGYLESKLSQKTGSTLYKLTPSGRGAVASYVAGSSPQGAGDENSY